MSEVSDSDLEFEDDDFRKYAEPYITSGGQRVWLTRTPDEPRDRDDPRRYWVYVNTKTTVCGHLDEPHRTNPINIDYWKTQNIWLRSFSSRSMAVSFLKGWCKHTKDNPPDPLRIVSVSVVSDVSSETCDSQETVCETQKYRV